MNSIRGIRKFRLNTILQSISLVHLNNFNTSDDAKVIPYVKVGVSYVAGSAHISIASDTTCKNSPFTRFAVSTTSAWSSF